MAWDQTIIFSVKWVKGFSYCVLCVVAQQNKSKVNKLYCKDTLETCLSH